MVARRCGERGRPSSASSSRGSGRRGCAGPLASMMACCAAGSRPVAERSPRRERAAAPEEVVCVGGSLAGFQRGRGRRGAWKWRRGRPGRGLGRRRVCVRRARGPAPLPHSGAAGGQGRGRASRRLFPAPCREEARRTVRAGRRETQSGPIPFEEVRCAAS